MYRTFLAAGFFCVVSAGTVSIGHAQGHARATVHTISIKNYKYVPAVMTVNVGDSIVWTNRDGDKHTVTSDQGSRMTFHSSNLGKNGIFKHTFKRAGTIHYHCDFHPFMQAVIKVRGRAA
ncbi:MAG: hypothetical protein NVS2B16_30320 [Chloroflexota bacterium]